LTYCGSPTTYGLYSGIFFSLLSANQILGNVSAAVLLDQNIETDLVFKILAGVAMIGLVIFLFLRPASPPSRGDGKDQPPQKSFKLKILEVALFLTEKRAALLACLMIYSGITQSFFFGTLPLFVNDPPVDMNELSLKLYLMAIFGVVSAIASTAWGKLSDKIGRFIPLIVGSGCHLIGFILLLAASPLNNLAVLVVVACVFGLGDSAFNTQIYGILGYMFTDSSEAAFASYKFYRASSTGLLFFCAVFSLFYVAVPVILNPPPPSLVSNFMKTDAGGCPDNSCPNMIIWFPILIVTMVLGIFFLIVLRRKGYALDALDALSRTNAGERKLVPVNET